MDRSVRLVWIVAAGLSVAVAWFAVLAMQKGGAGTLILLGARRERRAVPRSPLAAGTSRAP